MSRCVVGTSLSAAAKEQVKKKFIMRWTSDNHRRRSAWAGIEGKPRVPLVTDDEWLADHAFHIRADGLLDERYRHAEPAFMAEVS